MRAISGLSMLLLACLLVFTSVVAVGDELANDGRPSTFEAKTILGEEVAVADGEMLAVLAVEPSKVYGGELAENYYHLVSVDVVYTGRRFDVTQGGVPTFVGGT